MRKLLVLTMMLGAAMAHAATKGVALFENAAKHRVDVTIDGAPFTSYLWDTNQRKPVLYPLNAPDGTTITRGYPFAPRPGERVDHPHHAGLWFNYGDVNGLDFWNNSEAIKPEDRAKYGSVVHDRVISTRSGKDAGELNVESTWIAETGEKLLKQQTRYIFARTDVGGKQAWQVDMVVTLHALSPAVFHDDKEGLLGMRVAHFLESSTEKAAVFPDASGGQTKVEASTAGATGIYRTSEGKTGDAAWGTRARWCVLSGNLDGKDESVVIFDHTGNPGYPAYWHARGYGLFAVNPLGAHIFDPKVPEINFSLAKGESTTFLYRVMVLSGAATDADMNAASKAFDAASR
jgi:hypothetical protein